MKQILVAYALFGLAASVLTSLVLLCGECYSWLLGTMILSGIILSSYLIYYRGRNDKTHRAGKHGPEFAPKIEESLSHETPQQKRKEIEMTQNTQTMSTTDNMTGAVFTVLASVLAFAVFGYMHYLLTHGVPPTISVPFADGLQPEAAKVASEAARIITIPIVLLSLWAGISRLAAHNIPSWKFFWYVDFVPSILLCGYLLIGIPLGIWAADLYQPPSGNAYVIWASFIFGSIIDIFANGRHRAEHPQAPFSQGVTQVGSGSAASEHTASKDEPHTDENTGELVVPTRMKVTSFEWAIKRRPQHLDPSAPLVEHRAAPKAIAAEAPASGSSTEAVAQPAEPVQAH